MQNKFSRSVGEIQCHKYRSQLSTPNSLRWTLRASAATRLIGSFLDDDDAINFIVMNAGAHSNHGKSTCNAKSFWWQIISSSNERPTNALLWKCPSQSLKFICHSSQDELRRILIFFKCLKANGSHILFSQVELHAARRRRLRKLHNELHTIVKQRKMLLGMRKILKLVFK